MRSVILCILVILQLCGCAAREGLARYPLRRIDRPYALPKGTAVWHVTAYSEQLERPTGPKISESDWSPFGWEMALTDRLTLFGVIIPWGVLYQAVYSDRLAMALYADAGGYLAHDDRGRYIWSPEISALLRAKILPWLALEFDLSGTSSLVSYYETNSSSLGLQTMALAQLGNRLALRAGPALVTSRGPIEPVVFVPGTTLDASIESSSTFVPYGASASFAITSQVEIGVAYWQCSKGFPEGYQSKVVLVGFSYYW